MQDEQYTETVRLLKQLIKTPSFSGEEVGTAQLIENWFSTHGILYQRSDNNLWAYSKSFDSTKPSILLNSHHDTVRPAAGWTRDPFSPTESEGKLYGLGSNDAGAALVCLMHTFLWYYEVEGKYNLILAATAEEENSGSKGIRSILEQLGSPEFGLVGEPTEMQMGTAEKGLMVLDCQVHGESGHAARDTGKNAIYLALTAIEKLRGLNFPVESKQLGKVRATVTQIEAGTQHNVVPDLCKFVIDVRTVDGLSNEETLAYIREQLPIEVSARSTRLNPSGIDENHLIVQIGKKLGLSTFGSPTLSDQSLMNFPTLKIGPGKSERSHTADEFVYLYELNDGLMLYKQLIGQLL